MQAPLGWTEWRRAPSPEALERLGAAIGRQLERGEAVCLFGPLGAGKTTLARGLVRSLARPDEETPSPTFTLMQTYETARFVLSHFDLYRLRRSEEIVEVGLDEALDEGAAVIEWSERLEGDLPAERLEVELSVKPPVSGEADGGRWVRWRGVGAWSGRALSLGD